MRLLTYSRDGNILLKKRRVAERRKLHLPIWAASSSLHARTPKLETKATHTYEQPGTYKVLVKVVDIFGNDTTKMVEVSTI